MDTLQAILAQAVMDAIPEAERSEIFTKALHDYLFKLDSNNDSPLSRAFRDALKRLTSDEHQDELREKAIEAFKLMLEDGNFIRKLSENMQRGPR